MTGKDKGKEELEKDSSGSSSMEIDELEQDIGEQLVDSKGQDHHIVDQHGQSESITDWAKPGTSTGTEVDETSIMIIENVESFQGKESSNAEARDKPNVVLEFPDDSEEPQIVKFSPSNHKRSNNGAPETSPKKLRQTAPIYDSSSDQDRIDIGMEQMNGNKSVHLPTNSDISKVEEHHTAHRIIAIECNAKNKLNSENRSEERKSKSNRTSKKKSHVKKSSGSKKGTPNGEQKVSPANKSGSSDAINADVEDNAQSSFSGTESESACTPNPLCQKPGSHNLCDCTMKKTNAVECSGGTKKDSSAGVQDSSSVSDPNRIPNGQAFSTTAEDESKAQTSSNSRKMKSAVSHKSKRRCLVCKKKLGLTAIKCRCGGIFCANHRYDKEHNCSFDYKALGAEEIRKNNPLIVAEKVSKL